MLQFILMGAQAAGAIMSYKMEKYAGAIEKQQIGLRLQQETLASNQESLQDLRRLEETLASQRAIMAARGVSSAAGSAQRIQSSSVRAYQRDEEARNLSMGFLKTQRKIQQGMVNVGVYGAKAKIGTKIMGSMMGTMGMTSPGGMFSGGQGGGLLTGGFGG